MSRRKVFKEIQQGCLNEIANKMSVVKNDEVQKLNVTVDDKDRSKENIRAVRRCKGKNAGSINKTKKSKEVTKSRSKKAVMKKASCEATSSPDVISQVIQEDIVVNHVSSEISNVIKDSVLEGSPNSSVTSAEITPIDTQSILLNKSVSDDSLLTSTKPSENYWKMLAEERRIALKETLCENEMLYDQIEVLETEATQLRAAVDASEKVLKAVGLIE